MKAKFTLLAVFVVAFTTINAQALLNGGFETWSTSTPPTPDNWDSYDRLIQAFGGGIPIRPWCTQETNVTNVSAGTSSAKLSTDTTSAPVGLIPGTVVYGTIGLSGTGVPTIAGKPFTGRPLSFQGAIKYIPNGADTAIYNLLLTKWDATGDSTKLVGIVGIGVLSTGGGFAQFNDTIDYYSADIPDSLTIVFQSSLGGSGSKIGSNLWVDDLSLFYTSVGLVHLSVDDAVVLFPNPASNSINLKVDDYMVGYGLEIYNTEGQLVKKEIIKSTTSSFDINNFSNGTYLYRVLDTENKVLTQNRFSVAK